MRFDGRPLMNSRILIPYSSHINPNKRVGIARQKTVFWDCLEYSFRKQFASIKT